MHEGDKATPPRGAFPTRSQAPDAACLVVVGVAACLAAFAGPARLAGSSATATGRDGATAPVARTGSPQALGRYVRIGSAPRVPRAATLLGQVPGSQRIELYVALRPRDPAALAGFANAVSTPGSPEFRRYLRPGAFGAIFGATAATVRSTTTVLERLGLQVGPVSGNRLIVKVSSTVATTERAFATTLVRYRLGSGALAYANLAAPRIPAALADRIQAITGLNDLAPSAPVGLSLPGPRTSAGEHGSPKASDVEVGGPQPCQAATSAASAVGAYTADELASAYGFSGLYAVGDFGAGETVAILALEPFSASDVQAYDECYFPTEAGAMASALHVLYVDGADKGSRPTSSRHSTSRTSAALLRRRHRRVRRAEQHHRPARRPAARSSRMTMPR